MAGFIFSGIIGIVCILFGISNMRGNISSLHSYHRQRVSEEDILPFGRLVGLGTVIIGATTLIFSVLAALTLIYERQLYVTVGYSIMFTGTAIGAVILFYAMKKYNKGIF